MATRTAGGRTPLITITATGEPEIQRELGNRRAPKLTVAARASDEAGASAAVPFLKAEAPVRTRATQMSVVARSNRAGPTIRYRFYPIGGTRYIKPNPWVARGARKAALPVRAVRRRTLQAGTRR